MFDDRQYDIFVSYAREDKIDMRTVVRILRDADLVVWVDEDGLKRGENWEHELEEAIQDSKSLMILMSPDSKASEWVNNEIAKGRASGCKFFPLLIKGNPDVSIPMSLISRQYDDVRLNQFLSEFDRNNKIVEIAREIYKDFYGEDPAPPPIVDSIPIINRDRLMDDLYIRNLVNITKSAASWFDEQTRACIFRLDPIEGLYIVAATGDYSDDELRFCFKRREGVVGQVWDKGKSYIIQPSTQAFEGAIDYTNFPQQKEEARKKMNFMLGLPIIHENQLFGVLSIDHPKQMFDDDIESGLVESLTQLQTLHNQAAELALIAAEILSRELYSLSFYTYRKLQHILQVARLLPMFRREHDILAKRLDHLKLRSVIYYRDKNSTSESSEQKFYILAASREDFDNVELSREFKISKDERNAIVTQAAMQRIIRIDDRSHMTEEARVAYMINELGMSDEQARKLKLLQSLLAVPIYFDREDNMADAVLAISSNHPMTESRLNYDSVVADAMRLGRLCGRLIASEIRQATE